MSRILIVEDDICIALDMREEFVSLGHVVVGVTGSAVEALRLVKSEDIDAAVLDIDLDGFPSYPVACELKRRGIPFVFVTGYSGVEATGETGGATVLRKPVVYARLFAALAAFAPPKEAPARGDEAARRDEP